MGAVLWKIQLYYNHRHLLYHSRNIKPDALSQFSSPRISLILRRPLPIMTLSSLLHVWWLQFRPSQGNTGILTTVDRVFKTAFCGSFQTPFSSRGRRPARELIVSASWLSCGHCFRPSPCGRLSVRCLWHRWAWPLDIIPSPTDRQQIKIQGQPWFVWPPGIRLPEYSPALGWICTLLPDEVSHRYHSLMNVTLVTYPCCFLHKQFHLH